MFIPRQFFIGLIEKMESTHTDKILKDNRQYISLAEATKLCRYSQEYLSLRARQGRLKAVKLGRNWATTSEWLEEYVAYCESLEKKAKQRPKPNPEKTVFSLEKASEKKKEEDLQVLLFSGASKQTLKAGDVIKSAVSKIADIIALTFVFFSSGVKASRDIINNLLKLFGAWQAEEARELKFKPIFFGLAVILGTFGMLLLVSSADARESLGRLAINLIEKDISLAKIIDRQTEEILQFLIKSGDLVYDKTKEGYKFVEEAADDLEAAGWVFLANELWEKAKLFAAFSYSASAAAIQQANEIFIKESTLIGLKIIVFQDNLISQTKDLLSQITTWLK